MEERPGYLPELLAEKDSLDPSFVNCMRLLTREINRIQSGGVPPVLSPKALKEEEAAENGSLGDTAPMAVAVTPEAAPQPVPPPRPYRKPNPDSIYEGKLYKPIKLSEKVWVPVKDFPKFNFVGKLLGPKGNTFKRLQQNTGTKMSILGRGSMRDKEKEEELRTSGDAKYTHLSDDLHVLIEVEAPPGQAHARLGIAIEEIKKFLKPELNDEIHQEQMREMAILSGMGEEQVPPPPGHIPGPAPHPGPPGHGRGTRVIPAHPHPGRGAPILRGHSPIIRGRGMPARRVVTSMAARSAAALPASPTLAHAAPRSLAPPMDPYAGHTGNIRHVRVTGYETYEPGYEYEAAYPESGETVYYEYAQGGEAYETTYPAPARVQPVTTFKAPPSRTPKRLIREATHPY